MITLSATGHKLRKQFIRKAREQGKEIDPYEAFKKALAEQPKKRGKK